MRTALASVLAAAVLLLAGCGGGSSSTTSTTSSSGSTTSAAAKGAASGHAAATGGARAVVARHGGFSTILPSGFTSRSGGETSVEYWVTRANASGRATSLTVFRGIAPEGGVRALTRRALRNLAGQPSFLPKAHDVSSPRPVQVDGQPGLFIDYRVAGRKPSVRRQVFVIDGEWSYEISDSAAPAQFAASVKALAEVIHSWRWR